MRRRIGTKEISPVELVEASIGSVVRTRDRVAGAGYACSASPDLHTICRSFPKIASALSAKSLRRIEIGKKAASPYLLRVCSQARPGACPCGGWGQHFSRAGETVARSTDTRAHFSISTPSAAQFLKSHRIFVQDFAADLDRQKGPSRRFRAPVIPVSSCYPRHGLQRT